MSPKRSKTEEAVAEREPGDDTERFQEPNPRSWASNNAAGIEFLTHKDPYEARLKFSEKPSQLVIDYMKDNGFRWNRDLQQWTHPIDYQTQSQDRLTAQRTYHKVVEMTLAEKGIEAPQHDEGIGF